MKKADITPELVSRLVATQFPQWLPLPIPEPLAKGEPGCGFPRPWSVYRWIEGQTAAVATVANMPEFAADLAGFLAALHGQIDTHLPAEVWEAALAARWDGPPVWFHGDAQPGNLLLDSSGRLSAVIDFGTSGIGDPACDTTIAWTFLSGRASAFSRSNCRLTRRRGRVAAAGRSGRR